MHFTTARFELRRNSEILEIDFSHTPQRDDYTNGHLSQYSELLRQLVVSYHHLPVLGYYQFVKCNNNSACRNAERINNACISMNLS